VSALIDHELGGGLGDCMVHRGRQAWQVRAAWAEAAPVEGSFVEDGNLPAVAGVLRTALTRPFCPENEGTGDGPGPRRRAAAATDVVARRAGRAGA